MKTSNPIWNFFSSVKLALFTLGCLAVTSIIGTLIPQKEAAEFYVQTYGAKMAQFLSILDIPDMYTSWWFLSFLGLLAVNLIVCSIDRFPVTWRLITSDNLAIPVERIEKMRFSASAESPLPLTETSEKLQNVLADHGWKAAVREHDSDTHILFSGKASWSRIGVYLVHLSILIIFLGAFYGQLNGFKGSIMLPERQSSKRVFSYESGESIDLGFEIRCDKFEIEFYPNNMPKEYRSRLTILENGSEVMHKDIEVNHPLKYKGITFYQSSYQGFRDFLFTVSDSDDNATSQTFTGDYQQELAWDGRGVSFGIINLEAIRDRVVRMKIWFNDDKGPASQFWMEAGEQVSIHRPDTTYLFSAKQRYATGLQVARDPGVWIVYIGCGMMLVGLYMAFFVSHRRIWVIIRTLNQKTAIELRGSANKNKTNFDKTFVKLSKTVADSF